MAARDWGRYSRSEGWHVFCTSGTHDGNDAYSRYIRGCSHAWTGQINTILRIRRLLAAVFEYSLDHIIRWYLGTEIPEYLLPHS